MSDTKLQLNTVESGQPREQRQTVTEYFRNVVQDIICFAILLTLGLMILSAFFLIIDDLTNEVHGGGQRKQCRWPAEWCQMLWNCQRNETDTQLHSVEREQRVVDLEKAHRDDDFLGKGHNGVRENTYM